MEEYKIYKSSLLAIAQIVQSANSFVYSLQGFQEMILNNKQEDVEKLHKMLVEIMRGLSVWGGLLKDSNNNVDYINRQFNGLDSIVQVLREDYIGVTKLPHTVLFGESPSGLGATGESEDNTLSAEVANFQRRHWYKTLKKYYRYVFLAKDGPTKGKEPKNWDLEFIPIKQMSEADKAQITSLIVGVLVQAIATVDGTGKPLITIEEAREMLNQTELTGSITLNDELYQKALKEIQKQQEQQQAMEAQAGGFPPEAGGGEEAIAPEADPNAEQNGQGEDVYNFEDYDFTQEDAPVG
jgi:hypothetical protein